MNNRTLTTIAIIAMVLICGYFASACSATTASSMTSVDDVVVSTTTSVEDSAEDAENVICPEIVPESSQETIILKDIMSSEYAVWLPGELPQTRWKRSRLTETEMVLSYKTAIVDGNCIISFGCPDDERTVYLLANLASVHAVREVCSDAELKGAERVVVCDISTYSTWFRDFTERRVTSA